MRPDPNAPPQRLTPKGHLPGTFGAPTSYHPDYCQAVIDWFNVPASRPTQKLITTAKGTTITEETSQAVDLPTMEGFANSINVTHKTLLEWTKSYDNFREAYSRAQGFQKQILIQNGTKGLYNPQFTIFVAKNCTDMRDKTEVEHTVTGIEQLSDAMSSLVGAITERIKGASNQITTSGAGQTLINVKVCGSE